MGTDLGLYCLECREPYIIDTMRSGTACEELIASADKLAVLREGFSSFDIEVKADYYHVIDLGWFEKHKGHKQCVINEYGGEWPGCHKQYQREGMAHPRYCNLKKDHPDECDEKRPLAWY